MTETSSQLLLAAAERQATDARRRLAVASDLIALHAECLSRSQEAVALSRELLAIPLYRPLRRTTGTPGRGETIPGVGSSCLHPPPVPGLRYGRALRFGFDQSRGSDDRRGER